MNNADKLKALKEQANKLPLFPGVYIMKNRQNDIIYIGKAKALKNRVTQYFGSNLNHTAKVRKMVEQVDRFETIICDSEYEALLLENSLIKQHQPKYNILLKDDKGYHYIKITSEKWPRIETDKTILQDGAEYIGPFYSGYIVKESVDEVNKLFKLPTCNRNFDKPSKPCLNYHIGLCCAPCFAKISYDEYIDTLNSARKYIIDGINEDDINKLKSRMNAAAENLDFETAARLRDRISALEKSKEKQKVILSSNKRQDIIATAMVGETACISLFVFIKGHLADKKIFYVDGKNTKSDYYGEFLQQYYQSEDIPAQIAIDSDFDDIALIENWLCEFKKSKIRITVPQKGIQKQLVDMCLSNAAQALSDKIERNGRETAALNELSTLLGLNSVPRRIEAYDISNTAGSENVGSMVVFIDGRPVKRLYRKFKIKGFLGQDDFKSLNEIIDRRFTEYLIGEDESFRELPDLILIDGGAGQLTAVRKAINKYELNIHLFGMVKDSKHKTRAITAGGEDIQIKANRKAFTLVTTIQDEVHRFAISYHRQRTKLSTLQLELTKIDGVGDITAKKLINSFKTVKNIKSASINDFLEKGFSIKLAEKVINYYKKQDL